MSLSYSTLFKALIPSLFVYSGSLYAATQITAADIGPNGYVITNPGDYVLKDNVNNWQPAASGVAAITIMADGVNLDLNNRTIAQINSASSAKNPAVYIKDASNVNVHHGNLKNLSGPGIYLSCEKAVETPCANIALSQLDIKNAGNNGTYADLDNSFSRPFSGGVVIFGKSTFPGSQTDSFLNNINAVSVDKVSVSDLSNQFPVDAFGQPTGGLNGLSFISVSNLKINKTSCHKVRSNDAGGFLFLGRTDNVEVSKFEGSDVEGERNANGIDSMMNTPTINRRNVDVLVHDSSFEDIRVPALQRNVEGQLVFNPRGNEALGVELNGERFVFRKLRVKKVVNKGPYGNRAIGIQVSGNSVGVVENCHVSEVANYGVGFAVLQTGPTPPAPGRNSRAGGIAVDQTTSVMVKNCDVEDVQNLVDAANIPNPPGGKIDVKAYGFLSNTSNTTFQKCTSRHVSAPNFDFNDPNVGPNTPNGHYVAGFALDGSSTTIINSCQTKHNKQGLFVRTLSPALIIRNLIQANEVGIKDVSTVANVYQLNKIINNDVAIDINNMDGFFDNNVIVN